MQLPGRTIPQDRSWKAFDTFMTRSISMTLESENKNANEVRLIFENSCLEMVCNWFPWWFSNVTIDTDGAFVRRSGCVVIIAVWQVGPRVGRHRATSHRATHRSSTPRMNQRWRLAAWPKTASGDGWGRWPDVIKYPRACADRGTVSGSGYEVISSILHHIITHVFYYSYLLEKNLYLNFQISRLVRNHIGVTRNIALGASHKPFPNSLLLKVGTL